MWPSTHHFVIVLSFGFWLKRKNQINFVCNVYRKWVEKRIIEPVKELNLTEKFTNLFIAWQRFNVIRALRKQVFYLPRFCSFYVFWIDVIELEFKLITVKVTAVPRNIVTNSFRVHTSHKLFTIQNNLKKIVNLIFCECVLVLVNLRIYVCVPV